MGRSLSMFAIAAVVCALLLLARPFLAGWPTGWSEHSHYPQDPLTRLAAADLVFVGLIQHVQHSPPFLNPSCVQLVEISADLETPIYDRFQNHIWLPRPFRFYAFQPTCTTKHYTPLSLVKGQRRIFHLVRQETKWRLDHDLHDSYAPVTYGGRRRQNFQGYGPVDALEKMWLMLATPGEDPDLEKWPRFLLTYSYILRDNVGPRKASLRFQELLQHPSPAIRAGACVGATRFFWLPVHCTDLSGELKDRLEEAQQKRARERRFFVESPLTWLTRQGAFAADVWSIVADLRSHPDPAIRAAAQRLWAIFER